MRWRNLYDLTHDENQPGLSIHLHYTIISISISYTSTCAFRLSPSTQPAYFPPPHPLTQYFYLFYIYCFLPTLKITHLNFSLQVTTPKHALQSLFQGLWFKYHIELAQICLFSVIELPVVRVRTDVWPTFQVPSDIGFDVDQKVFDLFVVDFPIVPINLFCLFGGIVCVLLFPYFGRLPLRLNWTLLYPSWLEWEGIGFLNEDWWIDKRLILRIGIKIVWVSRIVYSAKNIVHT